jgi:hypothetical protein
LTSKYNRYSKEELVKIIEDRDRKPLIVMHEDSGRWMTLRYNEKTDKLEPDAVFRVDALAEF